jgi:signal transduction histidine kinase
VIQIGWDETAVGVEESLFTEWQDVYERLVQFEKLIIPNIIAGFVLLIAGIILLIYSAKDEKEKMGILHKAPVAMYSGVLVFVEVGLLFLFIEAIPMLLMEYGKGSVDLGIVLWSVTACVMLWIAFTWFQNIVTRIKCRSFWRTTEIYYLYLLLKKSWKFAEKPVKKVWEIITSPFRAVANIFREVRQLARENTPLFVGGLVVFGLISFGEWLIVVGLRWNIEALVMYFIFAKLVEGVLLAIVLLQMQRLHEGGKRIAAGDYSMPVDTQKMFWKLKEHGENINKVSEGISLAVNERMKSEHFKTELITNVSHDIKTPLTSIINYVDLIKKEDIQDEKVQEYVDVLDRQSARLKKLIEDLMEASKASTGNLAVNLEECDVEVLLTQVIGEFEEKLQKNQLEVVVDKPEHPVKMMADGRHMWRLLDNLLNNACKYSLPGSRVYVSLKQEGSEAIIVFKNISKTALNIPSEELMERFVRGDSSRNTEGSGLGLSIAQSLTELMQGSMKLEIDGDLFKVTLRFPMLTIQ